MPLLSRTRGLGLGSRWKSCFRNMPRAHHNDTRSSWPLLVVQPWGCVHLSQHNVAKGSEVLV